MIKVFLVEDEAIVRDSIKKNIDWEKYGYTFCGEAGDGELAYSLIREKKPDVVISDIKMPFMDGLELGKLLHREMPQVKIIYLTGYGEFDYAKQAIHIGAIEYLLKPVSGSALAETLQRVADRLREEKQQQAFLEQYRRDMQEKERQDRLAFFEELVTGGNTVPGLLRRAGELGLSLSGACYAIALLCLYRGGQAGQPYSEELVQAQSRLDDAFATQKRVLVFRRGIEGYALLIRGEDEPALRAAVEELERLIETTLADFPGVQYFAGVGDSVGRIGDIPRTYHNASHALAHRYLGENNRILHSGDIQSLGVREADGLDVNAVDVSKLNRQVTERFLHSGVREEAGYFIDELFDSIGTAQLESLLLRQYVVMDAYFACAQFLEELAVPKGSFVERCGDLQQLAERLCTLEGAKAFLADLLSQVCRLRDEGAQRKYGSVIRQAQDYIREHYRDDISLNTVAKAVNISPTHFSAIFSKETGSTFIEHLTTVRMDKAKEMLRLTGRKTSEIALEVGYQNPHYFSFLFKKLHGRTPREFRAMGEG